ncbi:MAG: sugar transferase [Chlamydiales bacterium]|nr:sugar transferase [Chlamydiales bacterium]
MHEFSTFSMEKSNSSFEDILQQIFPIDVRHNTLKRTFDVVFSIFTLLMLLPFFCIIALIIISTSQGPIFYGHKRIGRGGRIFKCYKFRTMYKDADSRLNDLLTNHPSLKQEWEKTHKLKSDPRITPIGAFLRKTSLDELPQFWNVIVADLSIVGPRPVVEEEIERHIGVKAAKILSIRPGITGLWQTSGRSNTSYAYRVALDEQYVDQHSFFFDIKLILKTIPCILFSRGAY